MLGSRHRVNPRLAVQLLPASFKALQDLIRTGRWSAAETALAALQFSVRDAEPLRGLAIECVRARRHALALNLLDVALGLAPDSAAIETNRGSVLRQMGQWEAAQRSFERAASGDSKLAAPCFNLGKLLAAQARLNDARAPLLEAVRREPSHVEAWIKLGEVEKGIGAIADAVSAFRRAIALKPDAGAAWWGLANLKTVEFSNAQCAMLDALWHRADLATPQRILIGFARAHAHLVRSTPTLAWQAIQDANTLKRQSVDWDAHTHSRRIDRLIDAWRTLPEAAQVDQGSECVFIVGLPRSGSTLVEQILAAHPQVVGASELPDLELVLAKHQSNAPGGVETGWATADPSALLALGREYIQRTARWREAKSISVDKTPGNFVHIGSILRMLPQARIIDCRRDARDTAISCLLQHFAGFAPWSNDLAEIAAYYRDYVRLMQHWQAIAPGRVVQLRYEDLVSAPAVAIERLLRELRLPFDPACLAPQGVVREVRTASAAQVRQPIDQRGNGRWNYFDAHFSDWTALG
jgi:tetratricopeptide (TPR) repeat protein